MIMQRRENAQRKATRASRLLQEAFRETCERPFEVTGGVHQIDKYVETSGLANFTKAIAYFLLNYRF